MVKVKVCGITRPADALLAVELGASALGFVFWKGSPRMITPKMARLIALELPSEVTTVGVFVNPTRDWLCEVADQVPLGAVQLHGSESVDFCEALDYQVIKAVSLRTVEDVALICDLPRDLLVLLDTYDPVLMGGTGRALDWSMAATVAERRQVFLAGGLRPDNVVEAVELVRPYGVDASSGLELAPGIKEAGKMRGFFLALKEMSSRETKP